jgi:hypothetical protein
MRGAVGGELREGSDEATLKLSSIFVLWEKR